METFANIIMKGLNRWNNLFPDVALCPKLAAFVSFLYRPFAPRCGTDISIYPFRPKDTDFWLYIFKINLIT